MTRCGIMPHNSGSLFFEWQDSAGIRQPPVKKIDPALIGARSRHVDRAKKRLIYNNLSASIEALRNDGTLE